MATRIVNLQRRLREAGRIRLGEQVTAQNGKRRPRKLDRFRFTSKNRDLIERAAVLWGGGVREWNNNGRTEYEVITDATSIPVRLSTALAFSQMYEQWGGGFCTQRCNGEWDEVRDCPCDCDPEAPICKITTRLSLIVPDIGGIGSWRLETHGYYAAVELGAAVDLITGFVGSGLAVPATLSLEEREQRRLRDGKPETYRFVVPGIDVDLTALHSNTPVAAATQGNELDRGVDTEPAATTRSVPRSSQANGTWTPVQADALPPAPASSVADQLDANEAPRKTRKGKVPVQSTGRAPRKASEVDAQVCDICALPYGAESLVKNPVAGGSRFVHAACKEAQETPAQGVLEPQRQTVDTADPTVEQPSLLADDTPSSEPEGGSGGGVVSDAPVTGPVPAAPSSSVVGQRPVSHSQHKHLMALTSEAWPRWEGESSSECDTRRGQWFCHVAALIGEHINHRSELSHDSYTPMVDALTGIRDGQYALGGSEIEDHWWLLDVATGEKVLETAS